MTDEKEGAPKPVFDTDAFFDALMDWMTVAATIDGYDPEASLLADGLRKEYVWSRHTAARASTRAPTAFAAATATLLRRLWLQHWHGPALSRVTTFVRLEEPRALESAHTILKQAQYAAVYGGRTADLLTRCRRHLEQALRAHTIVVTAVSGGSLELVQQLIEQYEKEEA